MLRATAALVLLTLTAALPALAQKGGGGGGTPATTYVREWLNFCGGGSFTTCASVRLSVTGLNVTLQAWNLSGGLVGGTAGSVIKNIALLNVPGGISSTSGATTAGTFYTGSSNPYPFQITSTNSGTPTGGSGSIELSKNSMTMIGQNSTNAPFMNGLASSCAATTPGLIPTGTRLWMTRTDGCTTSSISTTNGANLVQFNFAVNQTFDPNALGVGLGITAVDLSSPLAVSNTFQAPTATPEPATMILLGSGLAGIAGAARRRRKERALAEKEDA